MTHETITRPAITRTNNVTQGRGWNTHSYSQPCYACSALLWLGHKVGNYVSKGGGCRCVDIFAIWEAIKYIVLFL
jgi:hypothetical protein